MKDHEFTTEEGVVLVDRTISGSIEGAPLEEEVTARLTKLDENRFLFEYAKQSATYKSFNARICEKRGNLPSRADKTLTIGAQTFPLHCDRSHTDAKHLRKLPRTTDTP